MLFLSKPTIWGTKQKHNHFLNICLCCYVYAKDKFWCNHFQKCMATPVCKHRANPIIIKQASPTASNTQLNSRHQYYPSAPCFEQVLAESVPDPPSLKIVGKHFQIFVLWGGAPKQGGTLPSFNFRGRQIPPHQGCWMMIGFRGCLQTGVQVPRPWYQVHSCLHTNGVILHSCSHRPICPRPRWSLLPMCSGVQTGAKLVHQGQYLRALKTLSSITCHPAEQTL